MSKHFIGIAAALMMMTACEKEQYDPDRLVSEKAERFAEAYFNFDYQEAIEHVDSASVKWINFAASNVTQSDIDLYNQLEAPTKVEVSDVDWTDNATATVTVIVNNVVEKQAIGKPSLVVGEAEYRLTVVERDKQAFVRMACLPQSEKQNRD